MQRLQKTDFLEDERAHSPVFLEENDKRKRKAPFSTDTDTIDLPRLRDWAWNGIPAEQRAIVWKLLIGYMPHTKAARERLLLQKRQEYSRLKNNTIRATESAEDAKISKQIEADLPRMQLHIPLFRLQWIRDSMRTMLVCLSQHRPATGYIQGINELLAPLFYVFLQDRLAEADEILLTENALEETEADSFGCFLGIIHTLYSNYTETHAGIVQQIQQIQKVVGQIDGVLVQHLQTEGVCFVDFCFRWSSCFLSRELPLPLLIRMWDTYFAEGKRAFSGFHAYVCCAFLLCWREEVLSRTFCDIVLFLQNPPTQDWTDEDVVLLLSEAYLLQSLFHANAHARPRG